MKNVKLTHSLILLLAAVIWGFAFVAQSAGMDYVGPFTFNCVRCIIGGIVLIPCIFLFRCRRWAESIKGGIVCGVFLCIASNFQQFGIMYTTVGKAGFITALYVIIVPIIGLLFKKRPGILVWVSVVISMAGMYLLCMTDSLSLGRGDMLVLICAFAFSLQIMAVDHFAPSADAVIMSCVEFLVCGILSGVCMLIFEEPSLSAVYEAKLPILYAGVMSCGVAYSLQIIGQKDMNPAVASLIMCLESVVSAIAGWIILDEVLTAREIAGCAMMFGAIVLAQLPKRKERKSGKKKRRYPDGGMRRNHLFMFCTMVGGLISAFLFMQSFTKTVYRVSERESLEHVLETTQQMNYSFQANIEDTWKRMNMAQKTLGYISTESIQSVVDYMSYIIEYTVMDSMYLLDRYGEYIDGSGGVGSWEISKDMLELFEKKKPICMLRQNVSGEDSILFAMPIDKVRTEDTELEFMVSEYDLDTFMNVLKLKSYSGRGIVCVVDSEGRCLFSTHNSMPEYSGTEFLFSAIQDAEFTYNDEISNVNELKGKMELGESGAVCITKDKSTFALSFTPLDIMDWSLVLIVDNDVISATRTDYVNKVGAMSILLIASVIIFCLLLYCLMTWISVRRTDQLLNNRDRMMNVLSYDTMSSYMLVDEDDMICRYVSTGTYNVLGITAKELVGKSFEKVVEITGRNQKENTLDNALKNWNKETTLDTERFSFIDPITQQEKFLRCKCFTPADGKIVVTIMDESKEEQQERVLREAIMAAESANNAKSDFLSNMSHDIRTPMNAIMGFTMLLDKYAASEEKVREYTRKITAASKHLLGLINDILDMSKIESGKVTLNIKEFKLSALVEEINSVLAPQAEARKQQFSVICQNIEHDILLGDRLHISQVIINLLSNSIKYTPEGGQIQLTVSGLKSASDNYEHLRFEVKDTGVGMSEEFLKTIFEPFTREANSTTSGIRGTGLGMAITKNLVDLMGGAIYVDSHPGKGSTFTVELELRISEHGTEEGQHSAARKHRAEKEKDTPKTAAIAANDFSGLNFLIAEDNEMNAEILSELIRLAGGVSTIAHNGREVLEIFENSPEKSYNIILMDIQMPVMNGYEATRAIRACEHPEAKTIPILAMTANAFVEDVQNALASGMNAHISKPVDLAVLKTAVKKLT